jgi:hypothetical protein
LSQTPNVRFHPKRSFRPPNFDEFEGQLPARSGRQTIDNSAAHDRAIEILEEHFATPLG